MCSDELHALSKILLDIIALLGYNQGGRGKAPGSPCGVESSGSVVGAATLFYALTLLSRTVDTLDYKRTPGRLRASGRFEVCLFIRSTER